MTGIRIRIVWFGRRDCEKSWMTILRLFIALILSVLAISAAGAPLNIRDVWKGNTGQFAKAAHAGAGFSFKYDGKSVGPEIPTDWQQTTTEEPTSGISKTVLTHASGLTVTREMRPLPQAEAVEYTLRFKNTDKKKTLAPLSAIQALDISFGSSVLHGNCVISSGGGMADGFLPPRNFAIQERCFAPTVPDFGILELKTEGGRSSNKDLPFFFIQNADWQEGLFVAIGWSGQWSATVRHLPTPAGGTLSLKGKIPDLEIALEPGEEIQGPTVLIGVYKGAVADGSNRLRRLIRDVYTPKLDGKTFLPAATYDHIWNVGVDFDETLLKQLADGAAAIEQEYFLLDAGWYAGTGKGPDWSPGLGNWYEVDKNKLPNGLQPVAEYVRAKGLKFGLWFEPERVAPGSRLAKEHPEWVLWKRDKEPESYYREFNKGYGLLDYGRPEVQLWVRTMLDHYIREHDVKYIRYDLNLDPLPYWDANDGPNRRGITQIRHVQGFYAILDWLRQQHPGVVLETCASGGRRIDLETVRRSHAFLISDYTVDPSIIRFHLFGINYFLPGNYHYVEYTLPSPNQKEFKPDDLGFQSMHGGAFGTGGYVNRWPEEMKQQARLHVATYKKLRRYLIEDYYPLGSQPSNLTSWSGWQFHDPADQSGFIQTFRTKTADAKRSFVVHKLEERALYQFTDVYGTETFEVTGSTAMTKGIEVTQEPMSSRVFTYRKVLDAT